MNLSLCDTWLLEKTTTNILESYFGHRMIAILGHSNFICVFLSFGFNRFVFLCFFGIGWWKKTSMWLLGLTCKWSLGILAHLFRWWARGVFQYLRNGRYLGSMKPFSEGDWIPGQGATRSMRWLQNVVRCILLYMKLPRQNSGLTNHANCTIDVCRM